MYGNAKLDEIEVWLKIRIEGGRESTVLMDAVSMVIIHRAYRGSNFGIRVQPDLCEPR